jgi:putative hydrolase of the HAD superfamily
MALDIAQVKGEQVVYIEDRPTFVEVAETFGIHGIRHTDHKATMEKLASLGFELG